MKMLPDFLRKLFSIDTAEIVYSDRAGNARVLFSERHSLKGKPDYIVRFDGNLVPIEVKSCATPLQPHPGHVLQLAAYCLLTQESFNGAVPYGVLQYKDRAFKITWNGAAKQKLLQTLDQMQEVYRTHIASPPDTPQKCPNCPHLPHCPNYV